MLSPEEEAVIVASQARSLATRRLPRCTAAAPSAPDALVAAPFPAAPWSQPLPDVEGDKPARKFKSYPIGYFHIDIAEVQTAEGKLYLFVAIDRTSKFAYVELHAKAGKMAAAQFLRNLIAAVVYAIHRVLTDNGVQFTNRACHTNAFHHIFDRVCDENGIEHRPYQGEASLDERPGRSDEAHDQGRHRQALSLRRSVAPAPRRIHRRLQFRAQIEDPQRLHTLEGLDKKPERFSLNPIQKMPGLNSEIKNFTPSQLKAVAYWAALHAEARRADRAPTSANMLLAAKRPI